MQERKIIVGIHIGDSSIKCSLYNDEQNRTQLIMFPNGRPVLPTTIDYRRNPPVIGIESPSSIKRIVHFIGRTYDEIADIAVESNDYQIVRTENDGFVFDIQTLNERIRLSPERILADILNHLKQEICRILNIPNDSVILAGISIPVHFNDRQRQAMIHSAQLGGFEVTQLINHTTAIIKSLPEGNIENGKHFIFRIGSDNANVSIVEVDENGRNCKILTDNGDNNLGGNDFDNNLMSLILEKMEEEIPEIRRKFTGENERETARERAIRMRRRMNLKKAAEYIKIELSSCQNYDIDMKYFEIEDEDIQIIINREEFEECNRDLFERIEQLIYRSMKMSGTNRNEIKSVIIGGGSCQIPKINEIMNRMFSESKIENRIDPIHSVSIGTCLHAKKFVEMRPLLISTVDDIFIEGETGKTLLVPKQSVLPMKSEIVLQPQNQIVKIKLFEGEQALNPIELKDIPKGEEFLFMNIEISVEGELKVSLKSNGTMITTITIGKIRTTEN